MLPGIITVQINQGGSAINILRRLNLTSGLQLCLDAGDGTSLPAASDTWNDLSGGAYHFYPGSGTGADAADPTINGTAGQLSSGNYLSFDGGDYLTLNQANPAWVNAIHQDNFIGGMAAWVYIGSDALQGIAGNDANSSSNIGFHWSLSTTNQGIIIVRGGGIALNANFSGMNPTAGAWNFVAWAINEPAATGLMFKDGTVQAFTSTYSSPSAGDATYTMQVGSRGNASGPLSNGSRIGMFCAWQGADISQSALEALRQATRGRFGV
jgi:hypothetical protein